MMIELSNLDFDHEDLAAIQAGIEDMEAGRCRPFAEIDAEFRQKHNIERSGDVVL